jgi:hypothetical protein
MARFGCVTASPICYAAPHDRLSLIHLVFGRLIGRRFASRSGPRLHRCRDALMAVFENQRVDELGFDVSGKCEKPGE